MGAAAAAVAAEGQDVWFCSASVKSPQCTDGAWGTASEKRAKPNVVTRRGERAKMVLLVGHSKIATALTTRATKTFPAVRV